MRVPEFGVYAAPLGLRSIIAATRTIQIIWLSTTAPIP
jgi:hypothetical protein